MIANAELSVRVGPNDTVVPDPNSGTVAALASAAFSTLSALIAAYFGIKVATEQSAQAAAAATQAVAVATEATAVAKDAISLANSTINGNPDPATDF